MSTSASASTNTNTKRLDRRTAILLVLADARAALERAAGHRKVNCPLAQSIALDFARRMLADARDLMVEAPASTRRRWKCQDTVNARKRDKRALIRECAAMDASRYETVKATQAHWIANASRAPIPGMKVSR